MHTDQSNIVNAPDFLLGVSGINWVPNGSSEAAGSGSRPAPQEPVCKCRDCGKPIATGRYRQYARCPECNAKQHKGLPADGSCKKCPRAWVRGRFAGLCESCAEEARKQFRGE